jgi:hypothetical protein
VNIDLQDVDLLVVLYAILKGERKWTTLKLQDLKTEIQLSHTA